MDKRRLFKIRQNNGIEFEDLAKYNSALRDLFSDPDNVPLVTGYMHFGPKEWKLRTLPPEDESSRLTLLSYIEGVSTLERNYNGWDLDFLNFRRARINFGLESAARDSLDEVFISTAFQIQGLQYGLNLRWNTNDGRGVYLAQSGVSLPRTYTTMKRFLNPNPIEFN